MLSALLTASAAFAGPPKYPFPTSAKYAQGFVPSAATAAAASASYAHWKATFLKNDCGAGLYRVDNGSMDGSTFSEGQGYGMVLTAYFGDQEAFDGLWAFQQKNLDSDGLMGWHMTCAGFTTSDGGDGSATDGDTDIGFGLVVAAEQWGGTYAETAKSYLATLKKVDFTTCSPSGRNVPDAGNWDAGGGCTASNTSYWMPGYYRVFQDLTGDAYWGKAADDVVALYNLAADPTTGIIVNEVDQNGVAVKGQTYDYNSCRIPWRAALDYLWHGTAGAKKATDKLSTWASSVGIKNIVDGYNANGTKTGQYTGLNAFVGGFTVGAMTDSQSLVDTFASYFVGIADDNGGYYGSSLRTLYLLQLSGNEWRPLAATLGTGGSTSSTSSGSTSGGSSGAGSTSGAGGGGVSGAGGSSASSGGAGGGAPPGGGSPKGGCACSTGGGESRGAWSAFGLAALAVLSRRARKRAPSGPARLAPAPRR
jgi:MYXO-CTERM domain-containing protein